MEDVRDLVFSQVIYMWRRTLSWDGSFLMPSKTLGPSSFVPRHLRAVTISSGSPGGCRNASHHVHVQFRAKELCEALL